MTQLSRPNLRVLAHALFAGNILILIIKDIRHVHSLILHLCGQEIGPPAEGVGALDDHRVSRTTSTPAHVHHATQPVQSHARLCTAHQKWVALITIRSRMGPYGDLWGHTEPYGDVRSLMGPCGAVPSRMKPNGASPTPLIAYTAKNAVCAVVRWTY